MKFYYETLTNIFPVGKLVLCPIFESHFFMYIYELGLF